MARRKGKDATLPVDIVSDGTLRAEDVLDAMLGALEGLRLSRSERKTWHEARRTLRRYLEALEADEEMDADLLDSMDWYGLEAVPEIMNAHCPLYCYYGSSEGDGACFGVWPAVDAVQEAVLDGEIATLDADGYPPAGWVGLAVDVNDHGNCTMYDVRRGGRMVELWAVV